MQIMVIGAHIDDCEFMIGGTAALYVEAGHKVVFVAVTTGEMGHHIMTREDTVARRKKEGLAAGEVLGINYEFMDLPECEITPTVEYRNKLVALMRKYDPDIVISHPLIDYHPDHRCTAELVLDASYMLRVPKVVPEVPAMRKDPCFFYAVVHKSYTEELKPLFCVPIDSVWDKKIEAMGKHESQVYEWLPWVENMDVTIPEDNEGKLEFIKEWRGPGYIDIAESYRDMLAENFGGAGKQVKYAEMLFSAPFGRQVTKEDFKTLFPFSI